MTPLLAARLIPAVAALAVTLLVEVGLGMLLGYRSRWEIGAIVYINLLTNPVFGLAYVLLRPFFSYSMRPDATLLPLLEVVVILVEWRLIVWSLRRRSLPALSSSAILNAASWFVGFLALAVNHHLPV